VGLLTVLIRGNGALLSTADVATIWATWKDTILKFFGGLRRRIRKNSNDLAVLVKLTLMEFRLIEPETPIVPKSRVVPGICRAAVHFAVVEFADLKASKTRRNQAKPTGRPQRIQSKPVEILQNQ
jgi:hypothetical protein